jgi:hypothetical protein
LTASITSINMSPLESVGEPRLSGFCEKTPAPV